MLGLLKRSKRRNNKLPPYHLDRVLLSFSKRDPWTIRDSYEGVQIFGATGSGKTSGSGATIARLDRAAHDPLRCGRRCQPETAVSF